MLQFVGTLIPFAARRRLLLAIFLFLATVLLPYRATGFSSPVRPEGPHLFAIF